MVPDFGELLSPGSKIDPGGCIKTFIAYTCVEA